MELTTTDQVRVSYAETDGKMMAKAVSVRTAKVAAKPMTPAQPASQPKTP
jgi:hypothetical protein